MSTIEQFDPATWLSQFIPEKGRLDYSVLEPILSFTLIWNLFETVACDRDASAQSIRQSVERAHENGVLKIIDFTEYIKFFRNRFIKQRNIDDLANHLLSSRRHTQSELGHILLLKDVLGGKSKDIKDILFALLFISYRVRNNLFHGEKNVFTLDTQVDLFRAINALICRYLEIAHPEIIGQQSGGRIL